MKQVYPLLILALFVFSCKKTETTPSPNNNTTPPEYNPGTGWTQAWSEEFEGTTLNNSIWNYETGAGGWGNAELQYYRDQNVGVADGNLVITAKRENYSGSSFTSGRITTQNKYSFKYGKIVGKMKLPEGYGVWPAFWMLGRSAQTWPACGEIDIMEMRGGLDKITNSTCHWSNSSNQHTYYGNSYTYTSNLSQAYHFYEVEWNATTIVARMDGVAYNELDITAAEASELRNNNYFIILNLAIGGNFFSPAITNQASVTATFPQSVYVDWVRVYTK